MLPNLTDAFNYSTTLNWMLKDDSRWKTFLRTFTVFAGLYLFMVVMNSFSGSLIIVDDTVNKINYVGYLEDLPNYLYFIFLMLTVLFYKAIVKQYIKTFFFKKPVSGLTEEEESLQRCIRFDLSYRTEYTAQIEKWWDRITQKDMKYHRVYVIFRIILIVMILVLNGLLHILAGDSGNWNFSLHRYPLAFWAGQIKELFKLGFILPPILYGVILITIAMTQICKNIARKKRFQIHPLSPDKCGGLHPLGRLSLRLFYIIIIQFIYLFAISLTLQGSPTYYIIYPIYLAMTVFVFFYPMMSVRSSMKESKEKELVRLSTLFSNAYAIFKGQQEGKRIKVKSNSNREDLFALQTLYKQAEAWPIWPFNVETLIRFATLIMIPFTVFAIQLITDTGSILYNLDKLKDLMKFLFN